MARETIFDEELEDSVYLDKLHQVDFVFETIVAAYKIIVPFLAILIP